MNNSNVYCVILRKNNKNSRKKWKWSGLSEISSIEKSKT